MRHPIKDVLPQSGLVQCIRFRQSRTSKVRRMDGWERLTKPRGELNRNWATDYGD